jgi:hypothetical protein
MLTKEFVMVAGGLSMLVAVAVGCFRFGAEFCPPTVIVPNEGTTVTIAPKLARDAGGEQ